METQNITLTLPKEVLQKVKLIAAQKQTSVSALLIQWLQDLVTREEAYHQARWRHLAWLKQSADLGTRGQINWKRSELHER